MTTKGIVWICTMAITGIVLMHAGSDATDPCVDFEEINDDERDISSPTGSRCDKDLKENWYRFFVGGKSAIIPTTCIKPGSCDTELGMWVDLEGKPMPAEGQTIIARACASFLILNHWSCCVLQETVTIRRCPGDFYVYRLKPTDRCPVSYCAVTNSTDVPPSVTVRHGYHISQPMVTETTTTQAIETTQSVDVTTGMELTTVQVTEEAEEAELNASQMSTEEAQYMDMMTTVVLPAIDEEKNMLDSLAGSGNDYETETLQVPYDLSTSSVVEKQKATTIQSAVIPATTTRSSIINKTPDGRDRQPAELIFLLNGHEQDQVLASFHANFTAAMKKANRHIHNITVKELCPIGDAVKILFWAYDKEGKLIPAFKVEEKMAMRQMVEEALGLRPHPQRQDIFQEYLALFIILIIIGFLCLIILLSSCMYLYCRRHSGHWDRALAEQYHVTVVPRREARIAESPYSDEAIMSDEILEKSHNSLGSHYPGVHDLSYPNSLSGIKAMNNKNSFNTYPNSYGSLPKDGIEGLVVPIDQLKPEKDALIIEDTVL